ncbi:MAG: NADH-quinone oxidoreductase subunit A [Planctomycetes bacterium]|nr:NADH-quinone oxidoreductase subunit A [Planctomycetota bacterium]
MYLDFASIAIFLVLGFAFVLIGLAVTGLIRPHRPSRLKSQTYECGEKPEGPGRVQFNLRFYLIAFLFVIFDVEIVFIYPVAAVFKDFIASGHGLLAFAEIAIFVGILLVAMLYAWRMGALRWMNDLSVSLKEKAS